MRTLPSFHASKPAASSEPAVAVGATTIVDVFRDNVRVLADRPALRRRTGDEWEAITWSAYGRTAWRIGAGLIALGVEPGDRVGILSGNRPEWHQSDVGVLAIGAVSVPVYSTSSSRQVAHVLGHSGARVCFAERTEHLARILLHRHELPALEHIVLFDPDDSLDEPSVISLQQLGLRGDRVLAENPDAVDGRARSIGPDSIATLVYTSGTTGPPKGAVITHANVMATIRSITGVVNITPEDRFISFLPLSHIAERVVSHFGQIVAGGETWFARSLATLAEDLPACRPTIFFAVPRVWEKFHEAILGAMAAEPAPARALAERYIKLGLSRVTDQAEGRVGLPHRWLEYTALDHVVGSTLRTKLGLDQARMLVSGAAPIDPDLVRWFHAIGLPVAEVYGQTEDCGPTSLNPPNHIRIGTVGPAIPGVQMRLASDGEVLVKGGNVCAGYFHDDAATAELLDPEGWMHSGDLGTLDGSGYLTITGRKKDLIINAAGKNIAPQELEVRLRSEPLISQAVVVGDRRSYLVALLTLDAEAATSWAAGRGKVADLEALGQDPDLLQEVAEGVARVNAAHAPVERIKKWRILPTDFTLAAGELTPTLKVKRNVVTEHYASIIEELYAA